MPNVIRLFATRETPPERLAHPAVRKLQSIAQSVSTMDMSTLQTPDGLMRAAWTLDLANQCIRIILADFRGDPEVDHLIEIAGRLTASIKQVCVNIKKLDSDGI
ncbi:hypothetical protein JQ580_28370 [Bradyrhizobium japonicum]|uniref:hypothetical protein n=1 Tax=Bradyrhizobium japonicum TaxID=375 RepID=UPI001BABC8D3|nr:hypothetical protein [Bradyrhizobium japonicum]MBR0994631.1 hypothetical protein [Bradyrhizobium japonicum]